MNHPGLPDDPNSLLPSVSHPLLFCLVIALFVAGLAADILLAVFFFRRRRMAGSAVPFRVREKPWTLSEVGLVIAVIFTMLFIASYVVLWLRKFASLSSTDMSLAQLLASGISLNGLGILAIGMLVRVERMSLREAFGMEWETLGSAVARGLFFFLAIVPPIWILMAVSAQVCSQFHVSLAPQDIAELFLTTDSGAVRWTIGLLAIVGAPVFEELFFRGFAYPALKQKIGFFPAMMVTSLLFASIHFHALSFVPLVALAIALTLAYECTGNLVVPMVMHSAFNLMTIGQMLMMPK